MQQPMDPQMMQGADPQMMQGQPQPQMTENQSAILEQIGSDHEPFTPEQLAEAIGEFATGDYQEGDPYQIREYTGIQEYGEVMGRYLVTDIELNEWSEEVMGRKVSGAEFSRSPELQDEYMMRKIQLFREDMPNLTDEEFMSFHIGVMDTFVPKEERQKMNQEIIDSENVGQTNST